MKTRGQKRNRETMAALMNDPKARYSLIVIDPQVDFHEGGSLAVEGAVEDSVRTAAFIRKHTSVLDEIFITLDTHHRNHIAHSVFWEDENGKHPPSFTQITHEDIKNGKWVPKNKDKVDSYNGQHSVKLLDYCLEYTQFLEGQGKYNLIIWPEHCLIGSHGHSVFRELHDALQEWAYARNKQVKYVLKGENCYTEMYSAIKADFEIIGDKRTQRDPLLEAELQSTQKLFVCGQALSHCVRATFLDILETWPKDSESKLVLLADACHPVAGFEAQGQAFVDQIRAQGCTVATTQDPIDDTPPPTSNVGGASDPSTPSCGI